MDVVVPAGMGPGATIEFEAPDGSTMSATVPDGVGEGDTFHVPLDAGDAAAASQAAIVQAFTEWFERESVGDRVDKFVVDNAHRMAATGHIEAGGENSHEWWPIYCEYQQQFEVLLQEFLNEAGCSAPDFLAAARAYAHRRPP